MKLVKTLAAAAVLAMSSFATQASTINVGGVTWDPDSAADFSGATAIVRQTINATTGEVSGFGLISVMNGLSANQFCSGCELSFQFGGFMPIGTTIVPTSTPGLAINYASGWFKLFVDVSKNATIATGGTDALSLTNASTGDGNLWLSLVGHNVNGSTFTGTVKGSATKPRLTGEGLLSVVGGLAAGHFDTNSQDSGADLAFTTSFSSFIGSGILNSFGTGNFDGDSIPAPSSLAVLGLGLIGLAGAARRKSSK